MSEQDLTTILTPPLLYFLDQLGYEKEDILAQTEILTQLETGRWKAARLSKNLGYYSFDLQHNARSLCRLTSPWPGRDFIEINMKLTAILWSLGESFAEIQKKLQSLRPLKRHFELVNLTFSLNQSTSLWIDHNATTETEIAKAIEVCWELTNYQINIVCVYCPDFGSKSTTLTDLEAIALADTDRLFLYLPYCQNSSKPCYNEADAEEIKAQLDDAGCRLQHEHYQDEIEQSLTNLFLDSPQDILLTLGSDLIWDLRNGIFQRLRTYRQSA